MKDTSSGLKFKIPSVVRIVSAAVSFATLACAGSLLSNPDVGTFSIAEISTDSRYHFTNNLTSFVTAAAGVTDGADPNLFATASTDNGTNRATAGSTAGTSAWAGSYWADTITLTGGTGTANVALHLSISGSITGNATGRYRFSLATPVGAFPFTASTDPNGGGSDWASQPYPDVANAYDLGGPYSAQGPMALGIELDTGLDYGVTYQFQLFLEAYSSNGGVADFHNTGSFDVISVPADTNVIFGSGQQDAFVQQAPEPGPAMLMIPGLIAVAALRRRRCAHRA